MFSLKYHKSLLALPIFLFSFGLMAEFPEPKSDGVDRPNFDQMKELGLKMQKVVFLQDDAQRTMVTKIFVLKHCLGSDLEPFINSAAKRYDPVSTVSCLSDKKNNRQLLFVSTGQDMMPYISTLIDVLDRPGKINKQETLVYGTGIAYGVYRPHFRASESMVDIITGVYVSTNSKNSRVVYDSKTNLFYFKDTPFRVSLIKKQLALLDQEIPQTRLELKIYEVRDSDLKDIGIDYLAWKNGPGLNLFQAGYDYLNMKVAETIMQQLTQSGIDLFGNFAYGFGGIYTAPAFDFSFIRILQQNGKAIINSSAYVNISNEPGAQFRVNFSPEYQNILKDEDHRSSVAVGGDATLTAEFTNTVITGGPNGVVNFSYQLSGSNVVERNNLGTEISDNTRTSSSATLCYNKERIITNWTKTSDVEQTIGVPFLCELPVLKYIFGTTTSNTETTHYFVTAKAVPVSIQKELMPGVVSEFSELASKAAEKEEK